MRRGIVMSIVIISIIFFSNILFASRGSQACLRRRRKDLHNRKRYKSLLLTKIRLTINLLSTPILATSRYNLQCLCASNSSNINIAHHAKRPVNLESQVIELVQCWRSPGSFGVRDGFLISARR